MASAWGISWGSAWGSSWGNVGAPDPAPVVKYNPAMGTERVGIQPIFPKAESSLSAQIRREDDELLTMVALLIDLGLFR